MKFGLTGIFAILATGGCATSAIPFTEAKQAPIEQVFLKNATPSNDNVRVVFVRDMGALGGAISKHVYFDGKKLLR